MTVRQVVLLREPLSGTFPSEAAMLAALSTGATDRFSAQAEMGYVNVVFNNPNAHMVTFEVRRQAGGIVYTQDHMISAHGQYWYSRGVWLPFPVRGRLPPDRYMLDLTIDKLPAGSYPFTVE